MDVRSVITYLFLVAYVSPVSSDSTINADTVTGTANSVDANEIEDNVRPIVRVKTQGLVRGRKAEDGPYYEYLGIHYATASRENRFKSPLPVPTWDGIKDAIVDNIMCSQYDHRTRTAIGIEDCLVLNVYTPNSNITQNSLPVMVYVHGGGFNHGSGGRSLYGPIRFMEEGVILITFNYRLSILGFLCADEYANAGIKDGVAVLKWVKQNIAGFGGDPQKVTIFGQSAGAVIVELILLSKQSEGLISATITQSGSALSSWAIDHNPEQKAFKIAKNLGYNGTKVKDMTEVLKNAKLDDLLKATEILIMPHEYLPVAACIESENIDSIISDQPLKLLQSGSLNIPHMLGVNKDEGLILFEFQHTVPNILQILDRSFSKSLPKGIPQHLRNTTEHLIREFYFNSTEITHEKVDKVVEYFTDTLYALPAVTVVRSLTASNRTAPVFLYEFAYDGGLPFLKRRIGIQDRPGVCHADELGYLFTQQGYSSDKRADVLTAKRLVKLWTNMAKYGDPTPETERSELLPVKWRPADDLNYLLIDTTHQMTKTPFKRRLEFWDRIFSSIPNRA